MNFKNKKYQFIFATTVLERGITIKDVDVVICAFGKVFDEANITQMLGRVGRSINNPYGHAYILLDHYDQEVRHSVTSLKKANTYL